MSIFAQPVRSLKADRRIAPKPRVVAAPDDAGNDRESWPEWTDRQVPYPTARPFDDGPHDSPGVGSGGRGADAEARSPLARLHRRAVDAQHAEIPPGLASAGFGCDDDEAHERKAEAEAEALDALALAIAEAGGFDWTPADEAAIARRTTRPVATAREGGRLYLLFDAGDEPGAVLMERDGECYPVRPVVVDLA